MVLAVLCLVVAGVHLGRLHLAWPAEGAHALTALGMAAMFVPALDPVPRPVWLALFGVIGLWFAVGVWRGWPEALHHVVCSVAMLLMLALGHGGSWAASAVGLGMAGYFAWHVLRCADRWRACSREARPPVAAGAAMGVAMTLMPLSML